MFSIWDYILFIAFIIFLLYLYGTWNYNHFKKRNVKFFKPLPFLGNFGDTFLKNVHFLKVIDKFYQGFPDQRYFGVYDFKNPTIWLTDPVLIKQITVKDFDHFVDHKSVLSKYIDPMFTNNLFALTDGHDTMRHTDFLRIEVSPAMNGWRDHDTPATKMLIYTVSVNLPALMLLRLARQKWRDMRSTLSPAFTGSKMRLMFPLIIECADQLTLFVHDEINNNKGKDLLEVEIKNIFTRYANDVIATSAFGIKIDSLKNQDNDFYVMGKKITDIDFTFMIKFFAYTYFPKLMEFLGFGLMRKEVAEFFRNIVHYAMAERESKGIVRFDMIQLLMEAKKGRLSDGESTESNNSTKRIWSDDEITSQAFVFFLAGFETSSTLLSYAAYEIATRPNIQEKLQKEIDETIIDNETLSYDIITKMKYIDMFISETLRYWPPVAGVDRVCVKPYTLPSPDINTQTEYAMNIGDSIFIPIRGLQKDAKYFPEPDNFDPERFSDQNKMNIDPFTYMPFGAGPRQCIGNRFALMEVKIALIYMLSNFSFHTCSKTEDPATAPMKITSSFPDNGIWIGLKKRNK